MKEAVEHLLAQADIRVNGDRPWDIQVHNPDWYQRVAAGGSLGMGESYMDGWWDSQALDQFFYNTKYCGRACSRRSCPSRTR
jgi:cyclopropane-fatty-acyl-phospholipid synthase